MSDLEKRAATFAGALVERCDDDPIEALEVARLVLAAVESRAEARAITLAAERLSQEVQRG